MYKKKTSCQSCNKLFIPSVKERKKVCTVMDYSMKLNLQGCRLCCDECDVVEVHCLYNECEFKGKVPGWRKVCEVHLSQIEEKVC